jgi:hypothetical protein
VYERRSRESLPPAWLTHDPESYRTRVDVPAAAAAGVLVLEVRFDPETNEIQIATADKERT